MSADGDPADVDVLVQVTPEFALGPQTGEQVCLLAEIHFGIAVEHCETYYIADYPPDHPHHPHYDVIGYWTKAFGRYRSGAPRGIALISIET